MQRHNVTYWSRMGGAVRRYHAWPTIQQQTNADHTWNVIRIYWTLFDSPPQHVLTYLLFHDCGESAIGDNPFPVKRDNPEVGRRLRQMEYETVLRMVGDRWREDTGAMTEYEETLCKVCDLLEMYEFGATEYSMGNKFATPILDDIHSNIVSLCNSKLNEVDVQAVSAFMTDLEERLGEEE